MSRRKQCSHTQASGKLSNNRPHHYLLCTLLSRTISTEGETVCGFCGFLSSVRYGRPFHAAVIVIIVLSRTGIHVKMLKILRGNHMLVSMHVSGAVGVNLDYIECL